MEIFGYPNRGAQEVLRKSLFFDNEDKVKLLPSTRGRVRHPASRALFNIVNCPYVKFLDLISKTLDWDLKSGSALEKL